MDENKPQSPASGTRIPSLATWRLLAGLLTIGLTFPVWKAISAMHTLLLRVNGLQQLPPIAFLASALAEVLWIPAVLIGITGLVMIQKGDRQGAARVFFRMTLTLLGLEVLLFGIMFFSLVTEEGV